MDFDSLKSLKKPIAYASIIFSIFGILINIGALILMFSVSDFIESGIKVQLQNTAESLQSGVSLLDSIQLQVQTANKTISSLKTSVDLLSSGLSDTGSSIKNIGSSLKSLPSNSQQIENAGESLVEASSSLKLVSKGIDDHSKDLESSSSSLEGIKNSLKKQKISLLSLKDELATSFGNLKIIYFLLSTVLTIFFLVLILNSINIIL